MMSQTSDTFLTSAQVRARYGNVSHMWLERRAKDGSGFPASVKFGRLRFWKLAELQAWELAQAEKPFKTGKKDTPVPNSDAA